MIFVSLPSTLLNLRGHRGNSPICSLLGRSVGSLSSSFAAGVSSEGSLELSPKSVGFCANSEQ